MKLMNLRIWTAVLFGICCLAGASADPADEASRVSSVASPTPAPTTESSAGRSTVTVYLVTTVNGASSASDAAAASPQPVATVVSVLKPDVITVTAYPDASSSVASGYSVLIESVSSGSVVSTVASPSDSTYSASIHVPSQNATFFTTRNPLVSLSTKSIATSFSLAIPTQRFVTNTTSANSSSASAVPTSVLA
ncbi:hypothetical protein SJAG_02568 [Schizosaccharomyces japonicus yFS275]|uniref:Uncharacterized protein n=1 Tax=Schizosaccharomyces japonicus (strain yFS275 / FY16936) TaxID=402676 RepID=B6K0L2_SCHJY|nr:hypothetical protein SJAG_02568 [Schizosaccharomyces japonicus yFS275]EEB07483.1 hypothetical protein SJAG_02568 [Schizosaccharomyces japonicus yFS275]